MATHWHMMLSRDNLDTIERFVDEKIRFRGGTSLILLHRLHCRVCGIYTGSPAPRNQKASCLVGVVLVVACEIVSPAAQYTRRM